ncbi:MAG: hypothetical protein NT116_04995, partial [Candidatus Parcubacteria bacterium]|nr:hypothetical protein [Candidatus Parcubacteria bacterium]
MEEYPVEYCDVCKNTNREAGILDLEPVTKEMRKLFKIKPLPEIYSHFIYGHAMSNYDLYWYFFTPEQAEKMPEHICDDCFTKMFFGKEIFRWAYMIRQEGFSTMVIGEDTPAKEENDHENGDDYESGFDGLKTRIELFGLEGVESEVIKSFSCDECKTDLNQTT